MSIGLVRAAGGSRCIGGGDVDAAVVEDRHRRLGHRRGGRLGGVHGRIAGVQAVSAGFRRQAARAEPA